MRRFARLPAVVLAGLIVASCAALEGETPAQRLFAAQSEFTIHQRIVIVYLSQPECTATVVVGCARPDVKATLKSMAVRIRTALASARASLGTNGEGGSVAIAAGLVRELAAYLASKEIARESTDLTSYPPPHRPDRARRLARA